MLDDPIRSHSLSLAAGAVLTVLVLGVCAVLALVRPDGAVADHPIVVVRDSGAIFVRVGDTLHPAMNLASARLIAGTPASPVLVTAEGVDRVKHGPLMGIPGAPTTLANLSSGADTPWTICDGTATTVVIGSPVAGRPAPPLLVRPDGEGAAATYLVFDGHRAPVDLRDRSVVQALRLDGVEPWTISRAALNLIPALAPITPPAISNVGAPGAAGMRVGTVLTVSRAQAAPDLYVVLPDGLQRIGSVAADLIRSVVRQGGAPEVIQADRLAGVPTVDSLPVRHFPARAVTPGGAELADIICVAWIVRGAIPEVTVSVVRSLPDLDVTELAQSDGEGPRLDAVVIGPGVYVRAVGAAGGGATEGPRYLLDRGGVVFGIADDDTARRLGLPAEPASGPWPVLAALPRGPALSVAAASTMRDGSS